jgi:formylglycine-generating enzyme required for sulfatase activity
MPHHLLPPVACIPAGPFLMGHDAGEPDEQPAHMVYLGDYFLGRFEVTCDEYARFVRDTGHRPPAVYELPLVVTAGGDDRERQYRYTAAPYQWVGGSPPETKHDHPVVLVRWDDALAYCEWLASMTGVAVRLPTEAEWEKAARGGLQGKPYPWGDAPDRTKANYLVDAMQKFKHGTLPVGTYEPNGYGLYDMVGNVWEWVSDWYRADYYAISPDRNPQGPGLGKFRTIRGGAWVDTDPTLLSCSRRHRVPPDTYSYSIGFRIAYTASAGADS